MSWSEQINHAEAAGDAVGVAVALRPLAFAVALVRLAVGVAVRIARRRLRGFAALLVPASFRKGTSMASGSEGREKAGLLPKHRHTAI